MIFSGRWEEIGRKDRLKSCSKRVKGEESESRGNRV